MEIEFEHVAPERLHIALAHGSPPVDGVLCGHPQPEFEHDLAVQRATYDGELAEPRRIQAARSVCRRCPALLYCQRFAAESSSEQVFLAGMTARERARKLNKRDMMALRRRRILALADIGISTSVIAEYEDMHATSVRRYLREGEGSVRA